MFRRATFAQRATFRLRVASAVAAAVMALWGVPQRATAAPQQDDAGAWQVFEIGRLGDVSVRVRVLRTASMADAEWLAIEFENRGQGPVELRNPDYSTDRKCFDLKTGEARESGSLASGNPYDMFPEFWKTTPVAPIVIQPGVHRIIEQPSFYSAALLGLPSKNGYLVKARIRLQMEIEGHGWLKLPPGGVPFEFQWVYPDQQGFAVMQERLKRVLATSTEKVHQAYYIHALLEIPEVARAVSVDELLAAIDRRKGGFSGREYIAKHLDKRFPKEPQVVAYYRDRLAAADVRVLDDLRRTEHIWDDSFVEPLVRMFEADPRKHHAVLWILFSHGRQQKDPKIARRLSAALLKTSPVLGKRPDELTDEQLRRWSWEVGRLGQTGDRDVIALVRPYLDEQRLVRDPQREVGAGLVPLPLRACDCALEAILTILDGDSAEAAYRAGGLPQLTRDRQQLDKAMSELRDRMIRDLKERLSRLEGAPGEGRN